MVGEELNLGEFSGRIILVVRMTDHFEELFGPVHDGRFSQSERARVRATERFKVEGPESDHDQLQVQLHHSTHSVVGSIRRGLKCNGVRM